MNEEMLLRSLTTYIAMRMFVGAHMPLEREEFEKYVNDLLKGWHCEFIRKVRMDMQSVDDKALDIGGVMKQANEAGEFITNGSKKYMMMMFDQFKRSDPAEAWKHGGKPE